MKPNNSSTESGASTTKPITAAATGLRPHLGSSWLIDPNYDLVVIVLTQRMFETAEPPQVHRDIQAAAYAAFT
jgi:CubicO group peptidase (beta-lactamase class C family)